MRQNSFNIVHLAVALLCVVAFVTIAIAVNESTNRPRGRSWQFTQLRGIHQGLVTYANSNKNWYPGIAPDGIAINLNVEYRLQILFEGYYITPEYAISPAETEMITEWDPDKGRAVTAINYSYAMLQLPEKDDVGRRTEWAQTLNSQAIVICDRNTGTKAKPSSIHTEKPGDWAGSVLWNDNHVGFEQEDVFETKYGNGELNEADRLFESDGTHDALMIHSGN